MGDRNTANRPCIQLGFGTSSKLPRYGTAVGRRRASGTRDSGSGCLRLSDKYRSPASGLQMFRFRGCAVVAISKFDLLANLICYSNFDLLAILIC